MDANCLLVNAAYTGIASIIDGNTARCVLHPTERRRAHRCEPEEGLIVIDGGTSNLDGVETVVRVLGTEFYQKLSLVLKTRLGKESLAA